MVGEQLWMWSGYQASEDMLISDADGNHRVLEE